MLIVSKNNDFLNYILEDNKTKSKESKPRKTSAKTQFEGIPVSKLLSPSGLYKITKLSNNGNLTLFFNLKALHGTNSEEGKFKDRVENLTSLPIDDENLTSSKKGTSDAAKLEIECQEYLTETYSSGNEHYFIRVGGDDSFNSDILCNIKNNGFWIECKEEPTSRAGQYAVEFDANNNPKLKTFKPSDKDSVGGDIDDRESDDEILKLVGKGDKSVKEQLKIAYEKALESVSLSEIEGDEPSKGVKIRDFKVESDKLVPLVKRHYRNKCKGKPVEFFMYGKSGDNKFKFAQLETLEKHFKFYLSARYLSNGSNSLYNPDVPKIIGKLKSEFKFEKDSYIVKTNLRTKTDKTDTDKEHAYVNLPENAPTKFIMSAGDSKYLFEKVTTEETEIENLEKANFIYKI